VGFFSVSGSEFLEFEVLSSRSWIERYSVQGQGLKGEGER